MQRHWVAVVPADRYEAERAYARDAFHLDAFHLDAFQPSYDPPATGDRIALVAATDPPVLFGLGRVDGDEVRYTHRFFDEPPARGAAYRPGLTEVSPGAFDDLAEGVGRRVDADRAEWFVMVALPVEAASKAEAVREFWTYVDKLGPAELPAFVWPRGDELAMQAYLLGERVNLDPEEDEVDE
jgi:hypothetical protein